MQFDKRDKGPSATPQADNRLDKEAITGRLELREKLKSLTSSSDDGPKIATQRGLAEGGTPTIYPSKMGIGGIDPTEGLRIFPSEIRIGEIDPGFWPPQHSVPEWSRNIDPGFAPPQHSVPEWSRDIDPGFWPGFDHKNSRNGGDPQSGIAPHRVNLDELLQRLTAKDFSVTGIETRPNTNNPALTREGQKQVQHVVDEINRIKATNGGKLPEGTTILIEGVTTTPAGGLKYPDPLVPPTLTDAEHAKNDANAAAVRDAILQATGVDPTCIEVNNRGAEYNPYKSGAHVEVNILSPKE
jgi:hypothetical protein